VPIPTGLPIGAQRRAATATVSTDAILRVATISAVSATSGSATAAATVIAIAMGAISADVACKARSTSSARAGETARACTARSAVRERGKCRGEDEGNDQRRAADLANERASAA
jgi:hypothetical protein